MPPRRKKPAKKVEEDNDQSGSEEEVAVEVDDTAFVIDENEEIKPFTNDYDDLIRFDSLEKLPSEVIFEIFSFLPVIPYYYSLQRLNKAYREKFKESLCNSQHLDLSGLSLESQTYYSGYGAYDRSQNKIKDIIEGCSENLKSLKLPRMTYINHEDFFPNHVFGQCKKLTEITFFFPSQYFSTLFRSRNYHGYYYGANAADGEEKTDRVIWSESLKVLNVIGLEKPRKGRRNATYTFTASILKNILERFPALETINFVYTSYSDKELKQLLANIVSARERLLQWRVEKSTPINSIYVSGSWYEEPLGFVNFPIPNVTIHAHGAIGRLNTLDTAKLLIEEYNINPNVPLDLVFNNRTFSGNLLDQIISKNVAYKQKHAIINYLLNRGALLSKLAPISWYKILSSSYKTIQDLLKEIAKYALKNHEGKMINSTSFTQIMDNCVKKGVTKTFLTNLNVLVKGGWSDIKDPSQDFVTPSILQTEVLEWVLENGCSIDKAPQSALGLAVLTALDKNINAIPIILKHAPQQMEKNIRLKFFSTPDITVLVYAIRSPHVPNTAIEYILNTCKDSLQFSEHVTGDGDTLLHQLISHNRIDCARLLLNILKEKELLDTMVNVKNMIGETPLHLACRLETLVFATELVNLFGADTSIYSESYVFPVEGVDSFVTSEKDSHGPNTVVQKSLRFIPPVLQPTEKALADRDEKLNQPVKKSKKKNEKIEEVEEVEAPSTGRRSSRRTKPKSYAMEEEEEEEQVIEEEEEEEKPKKKRKAATKRKKKDESEEEEEEQPKKKKKASKKKKKEESEEEEEEEPVKKARVSKRTQRKKK